MTRNNGSVGGAVSLNHRFPHLIKSPVVRNVTASFSRSHKPVRLLFSTSLTIQSLVTHPVSWTSNKNSVVVGGSDQRTPSATHDASVFKLSSEVRRQNRFGLAEDWPVAPTSCGRRGTFECREVE